MTQGHRQLIPLITITDWRENRVQVVYKSIFIFDFFLPFLELFFWSASQSPIVLFAFIVSGKGKLR